MTAPVSNYRIPIVGPEAPETAWQEASRNHVWSARHAADAPFPTISEATDEGIVQLPKRDRVFHVIRAGTLHRIAHGFGFWRVCGADATYIGSSYEGGYAHLMLIGLHYSGYKTDTLRWLCPGCGAALREVEVPTRRIRLAGLIETALAQVRSFNADESARTCTACGTRHPHSYGFEPAHDDDVERAARASW
jgi:hypothetical protein